MTQDSLPVSRVLGRCMRENAGIRSVEHFVPPRVFSKLIAPSGATIVETTIAVMTIAVTTCPVALVVRFRMLVLWLCERGVGCGSLVILYDIVKANNLLLRNRQGGLGGYAIKPCVAVLCSPNVPNSARSWIADAYGKHARKLLRTGFRSAKPDSHAEDEDEAFCPTIRTCVPTLKEDGSDLTYFFNQTKFCVLLRV